MSDLGITITRSMLNTEHAELIAQYARRRAVEAAELAEMLARRGCHTDPTIVAPAIAGTVLKVGPGRGFVVESRNESVVITASHCLPNLPPRMNFSYTEERTYGNLLGPLGGEPTVWCECLFADPVADIAVLGPPDGQVLFDEYAAYEALMEDAIAFPLAPAPTQGEAWMLALDGLWKPCHAAHIGGPLTIADGQIDGGMSGSPVALRNGAAIGVVASNQAQPNLSAHLPGWLLAYARTRP